MADIIDEHGNPIQLTDEQGQQVRLTDEHGVPMHLIGVAQPMMPDAGAGTLADHHQSTVVSGGVGQPMIGGVEQPVIGGVGDVIGGHKQQLGKTGTSSSGSSSSEENDNGEGVRRRKKKGLMQKIKEKLPGHKNEDGQEQVVLPEKVYTATTKVTVTTPAGPISEPKAEYVHVEHHEEEHEKKGLMDKIKDKVLPGHH